MIDEPREEDLCKEAEEMVISIVLMQPDLVDRISAFIGPGSFVDPVLAKIFGVVADVRNSGDAKLKSKVVNEIAKRGLIKEFGGVSAFQELTDRAPNVAHADYYAQEVARYSEMRKMRIAAIQMLEQLKDVRADTARCLQSFTSKVEGVGSSKDASFVALTSKVEELTKQHQKYKDEGENPAAWQVPTGFPRLDDLIGGLTPGGLYLLGGRTGMGKTAIALNIAQKAAEADKVVWFCSLEMTAGELTQRVLSSNVDIPAGAWRKGLGVTHIECARKWNEDNASKMRFWITDKSESFTTLKAKSRLRKSLDGLDLLIVDNLQLVRPFDYRAPKHERLKAITEAFKNQFAKELGVAVLLLCQLAVDAEPGKDERDPDNTSWADSKRIVDDADVAMILHRPLQGDPRIIMTKNRAGQLRNVKLRWEPHWQRFHDEGFV